MMRIGFGYDVHRLVEGRKLFLGGVEIPFEKGLLGHSDADVLLHALCDGLLGAAGRGDIGRHFPDTDPQYKGIASLELLAKTFQIISQAGFVVNNIDATIVTEAPQITPHSDYMMENIAKVLNIDHNRINIKATTAEGLGIIGAGAAIAAYCVVTICAGES
ncbi:MAG: 2-C-methyl-D-erythritol 2,4-cyclodiphosphate synthase [Deltaproteobacteria bacterium]|nr:2-C-methyl-D-erythritol 2,4-cyclodiphosphate synthase [Deltaproteobacteria bacterium]